MAGAWMHCSCYNPFDALLHDCRIGKEIRRIIGPIKLGPKPTRSDQRAQSFSFSFSELSIVDAFPLSRLDSFPSP